MPLAISAACFGAGDFADEAGHDRHAGLDRQFLRFDLVAHRRDRFGRRPDERDPGLVERLGEALALAQKAIARMHRLGARRLARVDDQLGLEIAFRRRRRAEPHALVGHPDMRRAGIGIGINRDRLDPHRFRGADHPASNLPAIGDQDFLEHGLPPCRRPREGSGGRACLVIGKAKDNAPPASHLRA